VRGRVGVATAAVAGVTSAVTMLALDVGPASATTTQNWAAGISASGTVLNIKNTPYVTSTSTPSSQTLASLPSNPGVVAKVLNVSADASGASASVASVNLGSGQVVAELLKASCQGGSGTADIGSLTIGGKTYAGSVPANTQIPPAKSGSPVTVTLNKQVSDGHGGIEVTALEVSLKLPSSPVAQTVDVSTADCAAAPGSGTGSGSPTAPAPTPQQGTLPVTG
jgi:hypothetical protein